MNNENDVFIYILLYGVGFLIAVFITRAVFSIGTIVKNLKAQTLLLLSMANAQGVDKKIIDKAMVMTEVYFPKEKAPIVEEELSNRLKN
jgi:hypothetical protein